MKHKTLALPLLALALAACDDGISDTSPLLREMEFTYQTTGYQWFLPVPTATAAAEGGDLVVRGQITSPLTCTRLHPQERREGRLVELRVDVLPADACTGSRNLVYTAVHDVGGGGTYRVRVTHTLDGQPWPGGDATYEADVRVP